MKHLKKWKLLYFFIACLILGFVTMPLFHSGYISMLWSSFKSLRWYYHILLILGSFFVVVALHELTHLISFLLSGFKSDMMIILFLIFYKENNGWYVKINFKLLLLGGGLVFVNLGDIEDEKDFKKARKAMQASLLAAPIFTLISSVLFYLMTIIFFFRNGFLVPVSFYVLLISLFFTYTSTIDNGMMFGDFKAYKKVKNDYNFSVLMISQYANKVNDKYLLHMAEHLKDQRIVSNDLISKSYFLILLDQALFYEENINYPILEKALFYANNPIHYSRLVHDITNIDLAQAIIFYLDRLNYKAEANKLFNIFIITIEDSKNTQKGKDYLIKQTKHILKLSDESEFLSDTKNIDKGILSFLTKHIPNFIESEQQKNNGYEAIKPMLPKTTI